MALLTHLLATGEMTRHVIHSIFGCLATGVAKVQDKWKHSTKQHRCCNKYITIFERYDPFFFFKLLHKSHYLLDDQRIVIFCSVPSQILRCFWHLIWLSYYTDSLSISLIRHFWASLFNFLFYFVLPRITDEGSVPEMRIWSILSIKSD